MMIYFRVAIYIEKAHIWQWKSTPLASLNAVYGFLKMYGRVNKEQMRLFFASSPAFLKEMLWRENNGLMANSLTAGQFFEVKGKVEMQEMARLELELIRYNNEALTNKLIAMEPTVQSSGMGVSLPDRGSGMYDTPYRFTLPTATQEVLVWARLLTNVHSGVLVP